MTRRTQSWSQMANNKVKTSSKTTIMRITINRWVRLIWRWNWLTSWMINPMVSSRMKIKITRTGKCLIRITNNRLRMKSQAKPGKKNVGHREQNTIRTLISSSSDLALELWLNSTKTSLMLSSKIDLLRWSRNSQLSGTSTWKMVP